MVDVCSYSDYYAFGSLMPGRWSGTEYRYGFNGMEKDDEVKSSTGTSYTTTFRQYDPRLGKWLSLDPKMSKYADLSPYSAMANNPIKIIDSNGDTIKIVGTAKFVANTNLYIAKLRATDKGQVILNVLENAETVYSVKEAASYMTSAYNGNQSWEYSFPGGIYSSNTIYYDDNPWKGSLGGADIDGFLIFGHELYHMYSDEMSLSGMRDFDGFRAGSQRMTMSAERAGEGGAMTFGNYLRTVYSYDNWKRSSQGKANTNFTKDWKNKGKTSFNENSERITGFGFEKGSTMSVGSGLNSQTLKTEFTKSYTRGSSTRKEDQDGNDVK